MRRYGGGIYCTQPYPCICKEAVSGFEPMTNKSSRHNFTAAPGQWGKTKFKKKKIVHFPLCLTLPFRTWLDVTLEYIK